MNDNLFGIALPMSFGTTFAYQRGYAFSVIGRDGTEHHMRNNTYPSKAEAETAAHEYISRQNQIV